MATQPLIAASTVRRQFGGISDMTVWRWVQKGLLPEPIKINGRNYWRESDVEALKQGRSGNSGKAAA
ncbi:helix-turn-helix transcriptional regulator [Cognatilysobacter bugurensis]|nr:helix-turn-helix domain-containing protein [Lysobacter bugurensis]